MPTVVVLSKYPEIFEGFRESVWRDSPDTKKIVVWDGPVNLLEPNHLGWHEVWCAAPFKIAHNANVGWREADGDIVYCGDDVRFIEPNTIERLTSIAHSDPKIGIVGARVLQGAPKQPFVPFVCVYIRRAVIDAIGYLDERFEGYGVEDADYCVRAAQAGFTVGYADDVHVSHLMMSTFRKVKPMSQIMAEDAENWKRFEDKWDLPHDRANTWKWIAGCGKVAAVGG